LTINFVETDPKKIYDDIIINFQNALKKVLYPGDERRIFLEQETAVIVSLYNAINESAKQNLLRFAKGEILDAIGEDRDTARLEAQKATVTIRFTLSSVRSENIVIPSGTKVTPDGLLFFETTAENIIYPGNTYKDIACTATVAGTKHNDLIAGQINTLTEPIAFVSSVSNTITSSGGSERELDDNGIDVWSGYRLRIRLAKAKISTAGHELGYIYYAESADPNIEDVSVTSPSANEILITVLMNDGELPTQDILDKVLAACSPKKVRPLTDHVTASAPTVVNYNITATYYISPDKASEVSNITSAVNNAVEEYKKWQGTKIGRDINPDELRKLMFNAGASIVDLTYPAFTILSDTEVAKVGITTITYGGLK
jgi:phage-related baseplate assembly protein